MTNVLKFRFFKGISNLKNQVREGGTNLTSFEVKFILLARFLYVDYDLYIFEDVFD